MKPADFLKGKVNLEIVKIRKNIVCCYLLDKDFKRIMYTNQRGEFYQNIIIRKENLKNYKLIKRGFLPF